MIISKAVDVEIFPNLFSITFVDLKSYLSTFEDCVDNVYMKIEFHDEINIVNLKTGAIGYCSTSEPVIKLKATLVID